MRAFFTSPCWPIEIGIGLLVVVVLALVLKAVEDWVVGRRVKRRLG